jgi:hypothetical protein
MSDPVEDGARAAAQRLASQYGAGLAADVEAALDARFSPEPPDQYLDPVGLGGLIVAIATLAWTVYSDLRARRRPVSTEGITRTVQAQLRQTRDLDTARHEEVITITIQETLSVARADQGD